MEGTKEAFSQIMCVFEKWDTQNVGTIRKDALEAVVKRLTGYSSVEVALLLEESDPENTGFIDYRRFIGRLERSIGGEVRNLSLPKAVVAAGGIHSWNVRNSECSRLSRMLDGMCRARTLDEALLEVKTVMSLGHFVWAYAYMRRLYNVDLELFYGALAAEPALLLPVVYTPTVGEACQKFGCFPFYRRGCYLALADKGRFKEVLAEYAEAELEKSPDGNYLCDCVVFTDGGRILGLGDLGTWGMGIPIGKLDLYTVCAGVNPYRTIPVVIDAGCHGPEGNTDRLQIRDHPRYTGHCQPRVTHKSPEGTVVNSAYYGDGNVIAEFMQSATELFGRNCLLQFEDFNSNDAFPLLAEYRDKYLSYNDDIQGTAGVAVAALLGALRLRDPSRCDLRDQLQKETYLFHGAGSANIGVMKLLRDEAGVPSTSIFVTNSRGLVWRAEDGGSAGNFRNEEQKAFAQVGEPAFDTRDLVALVERVKPSCVVGAVGVAPNCFTKPMVEALVRLNQLRPVIFALSNPKTQAEITAENAYTWSGGKAIFGSGTWFAPVDFGGKRHSPGQVNNVYIFPGMSFGAICCEAKTIPERFFMAAAEAVANSLDDEDINADQVVPRRDRIQEVSLNVATAVVLEAQSAGLAGKVLGDTPEAVKAALSGMRWMPSVQRA